MKLPYGYILINETIEVHKEKADVVRNIFDDYLAGARLGKIVDMLFKRGGSLSDRKSKMDKGSCG